MRPIDVMRFIGGRMCTSHRFYSVIYQIGTIQLWNISCRTLTMCWKPWFSCLRVWVARTHIALLLHIEEASTPNIRDKAYMVFLLSQHETTIRFVFTSCVYRKTSDICRTLVVNKIVDQSDVYIFILDLTSGFKRFGKESHKTVRESFKCWNLMRLI